MEQSDNAVLVQCATLSDIERIVARTIDKRMRDFYESIRQKPPTLVRRKDAAARLRVSLPTLDAYNKAGLIHARHIGGRVYYEDDEIERFLSSRSYGRDAVAFP